MEYIINIHIFILISVFLWEPIEQFFKTDLTINVSDMYLSVEQRSHEFDCPTRVLPIEPW